MAQIFGNGTIKMNFAEVNAAAAEMGTVIDNIKAIFKEIEKEIISLQENETFNTDKATQEMLLAGQKAVLEVNKKAEDARSFCTFLNDYVVSLQETDAASATDYAGLGTDGNA